MRRKDLSQGTRPSCTAMPSAVCLEMLRCSNMMWTQENRFSFDEIKSVLSILLVLILILILIHGVHVYRRTPSNTNFVSITVSYQILYHIRYQGGQSVARHRVGPSMLLEAHLGRPKSGDTRGFLGGF